MSAGVSRAPESRGAASPPHSDWGSSESEMSVGASRAPESAGSTGSSAELWASAGGAMSMSTPSSGAATSKPARDAFPAFPARESEPRRERERDDASTFTSTRRFVDRLDASESEDADDAAANARSASPLTAVTAVTATESPFESVATSAWHSASRGAGAAGRTPTVYFPESPEEAALEEELRRLERADAIAADFVAEGNVVSPGPTSMARVGHKLSGLHTHTATVYTLSPTSPLVGPRDGAPSRSPSTSSGSGSGSEGGSSRRASPPGDNAAAAAVRGGHVAAARAVFEREAAMRSYESHSPVVAHRGSRVRR